jgi:opacity protein-like surface antigen
MRKWLFGAALAVAMVAPASAQSDRGGYIGLEGGLLFPKNIELDETLIFTSPTDPMTFDDGARFRLDNGLDVDLIGGYDFGMIRAELELGYKTASVDELGGVAWSDTPGNPFIDGQGDVRVWSAMGNALLDLDIGDHLSLFGGGGLGWSRVKLDDVGTDSFQLSESESGLAWQLIAGARTALGPNFELGLKYRYFSGPKLSYQAEYPGLTQEFDGARFRSHSLLASVIYNFGVEGPPPPPPPAPLAPPTPPPAATQTCQDGSVILVTDSCPPPPPPPAQPGPERG